MDSAAKRGVITHKEPPGTEVPPEIPGYVVVREISHGGQAVVYLGRREPRHASGREPRQTPGEDSPAQTTAITAAVSDAGAPAAGVIEPGSGEDPGLRERGEKKSAAALVAIKVLHRWRIRAGSEGSASARRFQREAEVLARLSHPQIVPIIDSGELADGRPFLVMPYIEGETLSPEAWLSKPLESRFALFVSICRAVEVAHQARVVHRDIKPGNIRVEPSGRPMLLDFGLAQASADELRATMTQTGQFVGSFLWASPEQTKGDTVTPAADVYALGVLLYQLLTGGAFPPQVYEALKRTLSPKERGLDTRMRAIIDPALRCIIETCLREDADQRYASAGELADAVEARKPYRNNRPLWVAGLLLALVSGALAAWRVPIWLAQARLQAAMTFPSSGWVHTLVITGGTMKWVPPGSFTMGETDPNNLRIVPVDERPQAITIQRGFYMSALETTQEEWDILMPSNPSEVRDSRFPVTNVSWFDAMEYCRRLSKKTGHHFRLPTEMEWEYAARVGSPLDFPFPKDLAARHANFRDKSFPGAIGAELLQNDGQAGLARCGLYQTNHWGLQDMSGNVWEWTLGPYVAETANIPTTMPTSPAFATLRGGSYFDVLDGLHISNRNPQKPSFTSANVGFRVVCDDDPGPGFVFRLPDGRLAADVDAEERQRAGK